jgi:hypothetical protein
MTPRTPIKQETVAAIPIELDQAFDTGFKLDDFDVVSNWQNDNVDMQPKPSTSIPPGPIPATPIVLSPSSSISTPPSPSPGSIVWDSPVTPQRHIGDPDQFKSSTPLTPPTTSDDFWQTRKQQTKPIFSTVINRRSSVQELTPDTHSDKEDTSLGVSTPVSDRAVSRKLFSNDVCETRKAHPIDS